jgi:hypothetical protein
VDPSETNKGVDAAAPPKVAAGYNAIMIDALSALSLYRQLEGLEDVLKNADANVTSQWFVAYTNQASFNHILEQITEQCADAPEYVRSLSHIERADIPKGGDRSVYPRFLAQVTMLKRAVGALLEQPIPEQKNRIGFS